MSQQPYFAHNFHPSVVSVSLRFHDLQTGVTPPCVRCIHFVQFLHYLQNITANDGLGILQNQPLLRMKESKMRFDSSRDNSRGGEYRRHPTRGRQGGTVINHSGSKNLWVESTHLSLGRSMDRHLDIFHHHP
jgi:hypothetical protein